MSLAAAIAEAAAGREVPGPVLEAAFEEIASGSGSPVRIAALLVALRRMGETAREIAAVARVLRQHAESATLADPLHPLTKALKAVSGKKTKTDDDIRKMGELEFRASLYYDDALGPVLPAQNFERMLRDAGVMTKRGKDVQRALMVVEDMVPIEYDGPRDLILAMGFESSHQSRITSGTRFAFQLSST